MLIWLDLFIVVLGFILKSQLALNRANVAATHAPAGIL